MKIVITGGAGFIGTRLAEGLSKDGHLVYVFDRNLPTHTIDNINYFKTDLINDLPLEQYLSSDVVIHLAGVNIFGKWTKEYKELILSSRVDTARSLIDAAERTKMGPKVFISASAVGYYGDGGENELVEDSLNGKDYLSTVCKQWEDVAKNAETSGMRVVSVRTGIVLGSSGGILSKLIPIYKLGLGGPIGNGKQWFSWIFIDDLINIYKTVAVNDNYSGAINAVSPNPVRNKDFSKALASSLNRPSIIPVPKLLIKPVLGELADVVLMSQKVIPSKLLNSNFQYSEPDINQAINRSTKFS